MIARRGRTLTFSAYANDIPEGTAMSHVHRTRQYLRERLADLESSVLRKGPHP